MANKHRGEVEVEIDGKVYPIAMSLDALARVSDALGVDALDSLERRLASLKITDFVPVFKALIEGNGHAIDEDVLRRQHWQRYVGIIKGVWAASPGADDEPGKAAKAGPQKRAS